MRKILIAICLCLFAVSSCYSTPLSEVYANQAAGIICFGIEDIRTILGASGEETTKVSQDIFSCLKDKLSIDFEKDIQQFGAYIVPSPSKVSFIGFIGGNFDSKNIISKLNNLATKDKDNLKMGTVTINGEKKQTLFENNYRIVIYNNKMLLICESSVAELMEKNQISFSEAPKPVNAMMNRSSSFIYLGKHACIFLAALGIPVSGVETIESVSAYLKNNFLCVEAGFQDNSSAKTMIGNIEKSKKDFYEKQNQIVERAKGSLRAPDFNSENMFDLIDQILSPSRNKDMINNLNVVQNENSIIVSLPFDNTVKTMIGAASIAFISSMAIDNFRNARDSAREKSCFSNIRVITGAVEMYNMDNDTMMTTLDLKTLVNKHYLRDIPKGPEPDCEYYSTGDLSGDGYIACKRHGTIPNMR